MRRLLIEHIRTIIVIGVHFYKFFSFVHTSFELFREAVSAPN